MLTVQTMSVIYMYICGIEYRKVKQPYMYDIYLMDNISVLSIRNIIIMFMMEIKNQLET